MLILSHFFLSIGSFNGQWNWKMGIKLKNMEKLDGFEIDQNINFGPLTLQLTHF